MVQLSHLYMTAEKTIALTIHSFVGKVISLLLNMLSRFVIIFLPRSKHLGRKIMTNLDSILKSRDITLPTKVQ